MVFDRQRLRYGAGTPTMTTSFQGQRTQSSGDSHYNATAFLISQSINRLQTVTLVKVVGVTNSGGVSPVGFVDVQPMVNQLTGDNKAVAHGTIFHIPYFRLQGGANAVILDPQPGDIGMCGFCSRDISAVKVAKKPANPGSGRVFDWADGLYFGGFLNGTPTQYVEFSSGGVTITSPATVTINASQFTVNAPTLLNGTLAQGTGGSGGGATLLGPLTVTNDVTAGGKSLEHHVHSGVQSGGSNTGQPV